MNKKIQVALGIDVDSCAGRLGSYGGQDSPNDMQRGVFAGEVGVPRMLRLFERRGIRTTWTIVTNPRDHLRVGVLVRPARTGEMPQ